MPNPNLWATVQTVYNQGDALTKQAINAVGGIPAIVNVVVANLATILGLSNVPDRVKLLVSKLTAGKKLQATLLKKLNSAAESIIKNI